MSADESARAGRSVHNAEDLLRELSGGLIPSRIRVELGGETYLDLDSVGANDTGWAGFDLDSATWYHLVRVGEYGLKLEPAPVRQAAPQMQPAPVPSAAERRPAYVPGDWLLWVFSGKVSGILLVAGLIVSVFTGVETESGLVGADCFLLTLVIVLTGLTGHEFNARRQGWRPPPTENWYALKWTILVGSCAILLAINLR